MSLPPAASRISAGPSVAPPWRSTRPDLESSRAAPEKLGARAAAQDEPCAVLGDGYPVSRLTPQGPAEGLSGVDIQRTKRVGAQVVEALAVGAHRTRIHVQDVGPAAS